MEVIGIDVSKNTFDGWGESIGHKSFKNQSKGFSDLLAWSGTDVHYVMESTCSYHLQLAFYLFEKGCKVSVVNPLPVKRYMQMKLQRLKTDKSDARMLSLYGAAEQPKLWKPEASYIQESKLMMSTVELYLRQQTALKNKLDNLQSGGVKQGKLISSLKLQIKRVKAEILKLEESIQQLLKEQAGEELKQLTSIPGVGKKTAALLLVYSNLYRDFDNYRQFIAYVGLCPVHRQSGTSVKGRSYISKKGNKMLRNHLFMCSFTARTHNPQCKALYDRLVAKGKSKKLALIAVCNKLIKQSFGVIRNGLPYDPQYRSCLAG
jgi:transposase